MKITYDLFNFDIQKYLTVDGSLLAGSIGLEPILYATKKRCITIMLRPNVSAFYADFNCRASQKIAIDSLFLDEGFGTLDEDSLETALNALNLLQSSGKMVGVISHVEALKERIPLQIKVVPKGDGTSFVEIN